MFKRNKRFITWLLTCWITLFQFGIVYAEYSHSHHTLKAEEKCVVCQVADQMGHAVVSDLNLGIQIDRYAPMLSDEPVEIRTSSFNLPYLIRGPPQA